MGVGQDWSVLMLRKSMAERKMMFFSHIVRKKTVLIEKRLIQGKVQGKGADLVPGFKRLDKAEHGRCISTSD